MEILTNAAVLALLSLAGFLLGYRFYSKYLATRIFELDPDFVTPAHELADGKDYVPTKKHVLFGHHYTSIAGAAPIVGLAVAVFWGWLPALLWVVIGTIFIGAVHDFGCLVISARNRGRSIGDLTGGVITARARALFLLLVAVLAWIVIAVFAVIIAALFVDYPASVLPVNFEIAVAVVIGYVIYKMKVSLLAPSLLALVALYAVVFWGAHHPISTYRYALESEETGRAINSAIEVGAVPASAYEAALQRAEVDTWEGKREVIDPSQPLAMAAFFDSRAATASVEGDTVSEKRHAAHAAAIRAARGKAIVLWVYALLVYSLIASLLPVWLLLQPRDFINSHQLVVGLGLMFLGLLVAHPGMGTPDTGGVPALNLHPTYVGVLDGAHVHVPDGSAPSWFPFLFVTIACGAISGFHGLVSSGTTSKQLDRLPDARPIGYGGMIGEGMLGLMSVLACTAGIAMVAGWSGAGGFYNRPWSEFSLADKVGAFVDGGSAFLGAFGVPAAIGTTIVAVLVISFAATTLDTATRIQRYVFQEIGASLRFPPLTWRWLAAILAAGLPILLVVDNRWRHLWPVFGATNQMLGALSFLVLTVYLFRKGVSILPTFLPFLFVAAITSYSLALQFVRFADPPGEGAEPNVLLAAVSAGLFVLAGWILVEGVIVLVQSRRGGAELELR